MIKIVKIALRKKILVRFCFLRPKCFICHPLFFIFSKSCDHFLAMFMHHRNSKTTQENRLIPLIIKIGLTGLPWYFTYEIQEHLMSVNLLGASLLSLNIFMWEHLFFHFFYIEHYQMHKRIYLILKIFISISTLSPWLTSKKPFPYQISER